MELSLADANKNFRRDNIAEGYIPPTKTLESGDAQTVPFQRFVYTDSPLIQADIAIIAFFHPAYMPFWNKRKVFRLVAVQDLTGIWCSRSNRLETRLSDMIACLEHGIDKDFKLGHPHCAGTCICCVDFGDDASTCE